MWSCEVSLLIGDPSPRDELFTFQDGFFPAAKCQEQKKKKASDEDDVLFMFLMYFCASFRLKALRPCSQ